jgi:hypothetical protein
MKITEEGKRYVQTREFAIRLNDTVELMLGEFGPSFEAAIAGETFVGMCLTGFGQCGCPTMCKDEMSKFLKAGGRRWIDENKAEIEKAILSAAQSMNLTASA